jgi:hypothetical protein
MSGRTLQMPKHAITPSQDSGRIFFLHNDHGKPTWVYTRSIFNRIVYEKNGIDDTDNSEVFEYDVIPDYWNELKQSNLDWSDWEMEELSDDQLRKVLDDLKEFKKAEEEIISDYQALELDAWNVWKAQHFLPVRR